MTTYEILHGDALTVLRSMPSDSIQCQICSPPYYGLRSYKTVPQIWDDPGGCKHLFGSEIANPKLDTRPIDLKISQGATVGSNVQSEHWIQGTLGSECIACGCWKGELGLEPTFQAYIKHLTQIFAEVKRVLKPDGTCFINLGDSYAGSNRGSGGTGELSAKQNSFKGANFLVGTDFRPNKETVRSKSLMNIPHRCFIAMTDELQMIQRNNCIWEKPAAMPSSASDRWTVNYESIGFFSKNGEYKFNQDIEPYTEPLDRWGGDDLVATQAEGWHTGTGQEIYRDRNMRPNPEGRNARTIWRINFEPQKKTAHYASYPTKLVEKMILAGTDAGDTVLDIFNGTASTGVTALRNHRNYIGIELSEKYIEISKRRLAAVQTKLF